jgi:putative ABC transport system permease protein
MLDLIQSFIDQQFTLSMRQDATISFVEPRSGRVVYDVAHLPGALHIEPTRSVPVRLRAGHRTRTLAITGSPADPELNRVIDRAGRAVNIPADGMVLSKMLGGILGVSAGDIVEVEVLEGARPTAPVAVAALVDDAMGLQAYMQIGAVRRLLREGHAISGVALTVDPASVVRFYREVKLMPAVAGVALRELMLQNFEDTMGENIGISITFITFFAGVIALGVVYASRCRSVPASWRACGCWASPAARFPSSSWASSRF